MEERELLKEITLNKAKLENLVDESRDALTNEDVYVQSCTLDELIVEYMRKFKRKNNITECCF